MTYESYQHAKNCRKSVLSVIFLAIGLCLIRHKQRNANRSEILRVGYVNVLSHPSGHDLPIGGSTTSSDSIVLY